MLDRATYFLAGRADLPAHGFHHAVTALKGADGCVRHYFDIGQATDAIDQVTRHCCREVGSAYQHPDLGALARQINGGLTSGVARADQRDFLISA